MSIGNRISVLLGERRWSQAELARKTGIRMSTINDLYHGLAERISFAQMDSLCKAFGCGPEEIFPYTPDDPGKGNT